MTIKELRYLCQCAYDVSRFVCGQCCYDRGDTYEEGRRDAMKEVLENIDKLIKQERHGNETGNEMAEG